MVLTLLLRAACDRRARPRVEGRRWIHDPERAQRNWVRLLAKLRKVRKYQRLFHNLGLRLQDFPRGLLDRISRVLGGVVRRRTRIFGRQGPVRDLPRKEEQWREQERILLERGSSAARADGAAPGVAEGPSWTQRP